MPTHKQRDGNRQTDRQTVRQTDSQTGRQIDRQADRQTDRKTDRQKDRQTCRQMNRYRQTDYHPFTINLFTHVVCGSQTRTDRQNLCQCMCTCRNAHFDS